VVQARDSFGNLCQSGGDSFSVQVQGVAREDICITDRHDGTYAVEYCVAAEGHYQASVTLDGAHVAGSPAPITAFRSVLPAAVISLIWHSRNQTCNAASELAQAVISLIWHSRNETCNAASELAQAVHRHVTFSHTICWHAPKHQVALRM